LFLSSGKKQVFSSSEGFMHELFYDETPGFYLQYQNSRSVHFLLEKSGAAFIRLTIDEGFKNSCDLEPRNVITN